MVEKVLHTVLYLRRTEMDFKKKKKKKKPQPLPVLNTGIPIWMKGHEEVEVLQDRKERKARGTELLHR